MKKLTPVSFTAEESAEINQQLNVQEAIKTQPKSRDPKNYPVFEVPVNKKVLIYCPNHIVQDKDGVDRLRMDKPLLHNLAVGKKFLTYRCISDIVMESRGFTGECPLCEGCSEPWDLANEIIAEKCRQQGLNAEDTDSKAVKDIRSSAFSDRAVKDSNRYYTFPIVVFETLNDDGKTFVKDEEGKYKYQIMWYNVSANQWEKTWEKTLEGMEEEPTHPGGNFFVLNYCYTPKKGEPNKRDSAQNLAVIYKKIKNSEEFRKTLDAQTESWTPELARQYVINNAIYSYDDLQAVTDEALESTRNLLALYNAKKSGIGLDDKGGEGMDGFKLEEKPAQEDPTVTMSDTDEDMDTELPE